MSLSIRRIALLFHPSHDFFFSFLLILVNTFQIHAEDSAEMKEPTPGFTTHTGVTSDPSPAESESTVAATEAKPANGETDPLAALATLLGDGNDVGTEMGEKQNEEASRATLPSNESKVDGDAATPGKEPDHDDVTKNSKANVERDSSGDSSDGEEDSGTCEGGKG
jgi:hypothetical protein